MTCPACGHDAPHLHIRDGGCVGTCATAYLSKKHSNYRCGCTRNPAAADVDLDDPSEEGEVTALRLCSRCGLLWIARAALGFYRCPPCIDGRKG